MVRVLSQPQSRARAALPLLAAACALLAMAATGFGASSNAQVTTRVLSTISITDPTELRSSPPICSDSVAPLDTDDCTDVSFSASPTRALSLGELSGTDVQAGTLQWRVTTTSPTGYNVRILNPLSAPVLKSTDPVSSIADMSSTPAEASQRLGSTHFGIAVGDPVSDAEGAVGFTGSPWITGLGQQGELFAGIPTSGVIIATRSAPFNNDPVSVTFVATSYLETPPTPASYTGTVRVTASII